MAYCTSAQITSYLGISSSEDNALLTALIDRAKAIIDGQTNRTFEAAADSTRNFDASRDVDGLTLVLDDDLASITSITNGDGTVIASTKYVTEPRNQTPYYAIKLLQSSGYVWEYDSTLGDAEDAIAIAGKWAYSETAPDDIEQACILLASFLYRRRKSVGTDSDRPLLTGDGVMIYPSQLPGEVRAILRRYKRM